MNMGSDVGTILDLDECSVRLVDQARVAKVLRQLPPAETVNALAEDVFAVLADPSRLRLLIALSVAEELCVCDAAASAGMSESATSHALRLMRVHGVVKSRRDGRMVYYTLTDGPVRVLLDTALAHVGHRHG